MQKCNCDFIQCSLTVFVKTKTMLVFWLWPDNFFVGNLCWVAKLVNLIYKKQVCCKKLQFLYRLQIDLQTEEAKETEGKMLPAKTKAVRSRESSARGAKTVEVICQ